MSSIATASGFRTRVGRAARRLVRRGQRAAARPAGRDEGRRSRSCRPARERYEAVDPKGGERASRWTPKVARGAVALSPTRSTARFPKAPACRLGRGQVRLRGHRPRPHVGRSTWRSSSACSARSRRTSPARCSTRRSRRPIAPRSSLLRPGAAAGRRWPRRRSSSTQGVATVRVQARMAASIQAAVWDRILNLPVNFFRKFSAGDLADRADGVDAIQDLVSGAGVAAILGSISGSSTSSRCSATTCGWRCSRCADVDLRRRQHDRQLPAAAATSATKCRCAARITGLVLNLLTGVTKLRVCGAEQHALPRLGRAVRAAAADQLHGRHDPERRRRSSRRSSR